MKKPQMKYVMVGAVKAKPEDGGQALIAEIDDPRHPRLFVRIHSWDESRAHPELNLLNGKKVEVTITLQDD